MEKKREKEIDFKLKTEDDSSGLPEDALPELIPSEESADPATVSDPPTPPALQKSTERLQNSGVNNKRSPFSSVTFKSVVLGLAFLAVGAGISQSWKWYWNAPRIDHQSLTFLAPTVLGGLVGDPDAAFAMQMVPVISSDVQSGSKHMKAEIFVSDLQKQTSFNALQQFVTQSSGDKSLSTLALCTTFSARGKSAEAVDASRPLIDGTQNPIMKCYLALLLGLNGDFPGCLTELNKGIASGSSGKLWVDESSRRTLYTMKSNVLRAMGRPDESLAALNSPQCAESFKDTSDSDSLLLCKAAAYLHLGQPDKAIVLACQGKELNRMILSTAYLMKGDYTEALTQAQDVYLALSRIYSQQGRLDEALKYADKADAAVNSVTTREQQVFVLNQLARYKDALAISDDLSEYSRLRSATGSMEAFVEIPADRALAFAHLGDVRNAMYEANLALGNNPNCRTALEAAKLASTKRGDLVKVAQYEDKLKHLVSPPNLRPIAFNSKNKR